MKFQLRGGLIRERGLLIELSPLSVSIISYKHFDGKWGVTTCDKMEGKHDDKKNHICILSKSIFNFQFLCYPFLKI